jgi:hypothetical protein
MSCKGSSENVPNRSYRHRQPESRRHRVHAAQGQHGVGETVSDQGETEDRAKPGRIAPPCKAMRPKSVPVERVGTLEEPRARR